MTSAGEPASPSSASYLRLVALGALIGVPAALLASLFLALVHEMEDWLWTDLPDAIGVSAPPWYLVLFLPVVGAALVVLARRFLPGDGGHPPLDGLAAAPTPWSHGFGVALAAVGTLAFGAVLGPEAPLIALGSVVGMAVTPFVRLDEQETAVVSTAGSFSAISALFGGPLVAGMLLIEGGIGMGAALVPALLPGLVSAAVGYVIFVGLGDWGGLETTPLTVPGLPLYDGTRLVDIGIAIAVGIVAASVIGGVRWVAGRVDGRRVRASMPALLLLGGFAVGAVALADGLGADPEDVLFSGQASVPAVVAEGSLKIVVVLLVAKAIGYAVSLGCGFRGGPVFPAVFLGVTLASVAEIVFDLSPTLAVAIGTAAGMAAMTRLLFAPILFAALLVGTNGADTLPATVMAAASTWITVRALDQLLEPRPAPT